LHLPQNFARRNDGPLANSHVRENEIDFQLVCFTIKAQEDCLACQDRHACLWWL